MCFERKFGYHNTVESRWDDSIILLFWSALCTKKASFAPQTLWENSLRNRLVLFQRFTLPNAANSPRGLSTEVKLRDPSAIEAHERDRSLHVVREIKCRPIAVGAKCSRRWPFASPASSFPSREYQVRWQQAINPSVP